MRAEGLMIYLEHTPVAPLDRSVRMLWYAEAVDLPHSRERILPTGCVQVILNLARDFFLECPEAGPVLRQSPSLVMGARSIYEIVDTSDMANLIGVVFEPGGFAQFASDSVDRFSNRAIDLEDVWGTPARTLRDRLREIPLPYDKLRCMEDFLLNKSAGRNARNRMVEFALSRFQCASSDATVQEVARSTGLSERRFSQVFREEVGLSPKAWTRIQRFQRAVRQLHAGIDLPWAELALECGYYDQSHFANDFRAFSGIDATSYSMRRTLWRNHVSAD